jgi:hypothetical protein
VDAVELLLMLPLTGTRPCGYAGSYNCDVDKPSQHQRWTPLYVACLRGHASIVKLLIHRGADVHPRAIDGQTALLVASSFGFTSIVRVLMEAGAGTADAWMGLEVIEAAAAARQNSALRTLRAYESCFEGNILPRKGGACVASWVGSVRDVIYLCHAAVSRPTVPFRSTLHLTFSAVVVYYRCLCSARGVCAEVG